MRLGILLAFIGFLASCATHEPDKPRPVISSFRPYTTVSGDSTPAFVQGTPEEVEDHHRLSHYSVVRWVAEPVYERTQSPGLQKEDARSLSVARRVVFIADRLDDEYEVDRLLELLVKDARHYIVSFVVSDDTEYERLSKQFEQVVLNAAKSHGHATGRWLRSGYRVDRETFQHIVVEAVP